MTYEASVDCEQLEQDVSPFSLAELEAASNSGQDTVWNTVSIDPYITAPAGDIVYLSRGPRAGALDLGDDAPRFRRSWPGGLSRWSAALAR